MVRARTTSDRTAARLRGLYAITPEIRDTERLATLAAQCLEGGAAALQYRAKNLPASLALAQAHCLAALCRRHGAIFIVNDSIPLALAVQADGVHLGRDDEDASAARIVFPEGIIGVSCYADPERARAAAAAGADYVAIGSVFASSSKPRAERAPLEALFRARDLGGVAVVAIGGITPANAREAIEAGADMVAVIAALFEAPDVSAAARDFARLFDEPSNGGDHVRAQPRAL